MYHCGCCVEGSSKDFTAKPSKDAVDSSPYYYLGHWQPTGGAEQHHWSRIHYIGSVLLRLHCRASTSSDSRLWKQGARIDRVLWQCAWQSVDQHRPRLYRPVCCSCCCWTAIPRAADLEGGGWHLYCWSQKDQDGSSLAHHHTRGGCRIDLLWLWSDPPLHHGTSHPSRNPHPHQKCRKSLWLGHHHLPRPDHKIHQRLCYTATYTGCIGSEWLPSGFVSKTSYRSNRQGQDLCAQCAFQPQKRQPWFPGQDLYGSRWAQYHCRLDLYFRSACVYGLVLGCGSKQPGKGTCWSWKARSSMYYLYSLLT